MRIKNVAAAGNRTQADLLPVADDAAHIKLAVDVVESLGDMLLLHGSLSDGEEFTAQLASRDNQVVSGDLVGLKAQENSLHYFAAATGKRISRD